MQVQSILFESNDSDVLVKGTINQGFLQFESDIIISHSQLNKLVNQLYLLNNEFEIENYLETNPMFDGETIYTAVLNENVNSTISLDELVYQENLKQIRA